MTSQFGLVCITNSMEIRYRTITRTRLLQHAEAVQRELLEDIYRHNIEKLAAALQLCLRERIFLYRIPSSLFPFFDTDLGQKVMEQFAGEMAAVGQCAIANGIRLVTHPDQFVVLSSDSDNIVANSVRILQMQADTMDLLLQPRTPWALIEVHGGKSGRSERLVASIQRLPDAIRSRLCLENDEYAYSAQEILEVCRESGVPMVFDAHHHVVHESLSSYEHPSIAEMLKLARATWPEPAHQVVHISNGKDSFNDRKHADLIEVMPSAYANAPWIEIEAKFKEDAIRQLRRHDAHSAPLPAAA